MCLPAETKVGDGPRWCVVGCDDQSDCDKKTDLFGGRTVCRNIIYPQSGGRVNADLCSDPAHGWGDTGNDPEEAADGSGG